MRTGRIRRMAAIMAAVLLCTALSGCGKQQEADNSVSGEKGGYVEQEVSLPEGVAAADISQIYKVEGKLRLLLKKEAGDMASMEEWELNGDSFTNVTGEWLRQIQIPYKGSWLTKIAVNKEAGSFFYAVYADAEGAESMAHLWKSEDGDSVTEITPQKWTVPDETYGYYDYPQDIAVLDNGILAAVYYSSIDLYQTGDGSLIREITPETRYRTMVMGSGEEYYLAACDDRDNVTGLEVFGTDTDTPKRQVAFTQEIDSNGYNTYLSTLEDGSLILCNGDGIYRCASDSDAWEKVVKGSDTSMGLVNMWCKDLEAMEDGSFYALFGSDSGSGALMRYVYDPEAVTQISQTLTVYSVQESSLLKQAAAMFHRLHPEVMVNVETVIKQSDFYSDKTIDYQEIYQNLNTKLMAGDGADILIMDGLDMDSFTEKGLLADINDVVNPLEEDGTLLSNITKSYLQEDGSRYVVPLQFSIVLAAGRQLDVNTVKDIPSLAETLAAEQESVMGPHTPAELVDKFLPYFMADIINGKELDQEALKTNLEYLKIIADNSGIIPSRGENERPWNIWELISYIRLAFYETGGFNQAMMPFSIINMAKGSYTAFEDAFYPSLEAGIYAKSEQMDLAKEFLAFMMSEEIQNYDYYKGFPINEKALQALSKRDRTDAMAYTAIEVGDGLYEEFEIGTYSDEEAQRLMDACRSVTDRVMKDDKVREEIIAAIPGYLDGSQSLEDTVAMIEGGLKMYLAE